MKIEIKFGNKIDSLFSSFLIILNVQKFNEAAERVKTLTKRPTDQELLDLYALFKQGTFGDNDTSEYFNFIERPFQFFMIYLSIIGKPGMFDLKGKAKWNAWNEKKGMPQDEAKEKYIAYVEQLLETYKE